MKSKKSYHHLHEQVGTGGDKILIKNLRKAFPLSQVTETLEVSRSTYYAQVNQKKSQTQIEQENLEVQIKKEYCASKGRYGAPKIHQKLLQNGVKFSLKRVQRLMRKQAYNLSFERNGNQSKALNLNEITYQT